jgi:hypothetical protein
MERIRLRRSHLPSPPTDHPDADMDRTERRHLSSEDMKHNFAVQRAEESAFGSPREMICFCVRCKWTFQVSPDTGSILAFNNVGEPLEGREAEKRVASFAEGPCPAFAGFPEYEEAREATHGGIRERLQPLWHLLGLDRSA